MAFTEFAGKHLCLCQQFLKVHCGDLVLPGVTLETLSQLHRN